MIILIHVSIGPLVAYIICLIKIWTDTRQTDSQTETGDYFFVLYTRKAKIITYFVSLLFSINQPVATIPKTIHRPLQAQRSIQQTIKHLYIIRVNIEIPQELLKLARVHIVPHIANNLVQNNLLRLDYTIRAPSDTTNAVVQVHHPTFHPQLPVELVHVIVRELGQTLQ